MQIIDCIHLKAFIYLSAKKLMKTKSKEDKQTLEELPGKFGSLPFTSKTSLMQTSYSTLNRLNNCYFCHIINILLTELSQSVWENLDLSRRCRPHCIQPVLKDVGAHCYCASFVRTLFIRHVRATSFSSARTKSKSQQNIELMAFTLTWCANIFVGCSVTPTFFSADHFLF